MDPEHLSTFQNLLRSILAPDNQTRKNAEEQYNSTKKQDPNMLTLALLTTLTTSNEPALRSSAAVYIRQNFRKSFRDESNFIWQFLSPDTKVTAKKLLLECVRKETDKSTAQKVCDAISQLGCHLADSSEEQWNELLPFIFECFQSNENRLVESGLRIVKDLIPVVGERLLSQSTAQNFIQFLGICLTGQKGIEVISLAVQVIAAVVESVAHRHWKILHDSGVSKEILPALGKLGQSGNDICFSDALESLIVIADDDASFFKPILAETLSAAFEIVRASQIDDGCRQLAFELITSLSEKKSKLCIKKMPNFVNAAVVACMECMLELPEEEDWVNWMSEEDEADGEPHVMYDVGEENIDRFAQTLGADLVLPVVFSVVGTYINSDWNHKVAALMAICQVAEVVEDESQIDQIVPLLLASVSDPHPRVRFAALHALGQVSTDCTPYVQENFADQVLPVLSKGLSDPVPRVACHAAAAFVNYTEEVDAESLSPFTQNLMTNFLPMCASNMHYKVREAGITAIAVISGVLEEEFVPYYETMVPLLKDCIISSTSRELRQLRGKAFECLSLLGMSVGGDVFKKDAHEVMNAMISVLDSESKENQQQELDSDDPLKSYLFESLQRVCRALKGDFVPYLPSILPGVLRSFELTHQAFDEDTEDMTLMMLNDTSSLGLKTSMIEDLDGALVMVSSMVESLGPLYIDFVQPTATKLQPLLNFKFDDDVKSNAMETWNELIKCTRTAIDLDPNGPKCNEYKVILSSLVNSFLDSTLKMIAEEDELELIEAQSRGIAKCVANGGTDTLSLDQVKAIISCIVKLIGESVNRSDEMTKQKDEEELDEDDIEEIEQAKETEDNVRVALAEVAGSLMSKHKPLFLQVGVEPFVQLIKQYIDHVGNVHYRCLAMYVCCDFLEHLGADVCSYWPIFMQSLINSITDSSAYIRQASCYAMNMASSIPEFNQVSAMVADRLRMAIGGPTKGDVAKAALDNAVAALLKVIANCGETSFPDQLDSYYQLVLSKLPLKFDTEEGQKTHAFLVSLVESENPYLTQKYTAQTLKIIAHVYRKETSTDILNKRITGVFSKIGQDQLNALNLDEKTNRKIIKILKNN